MVNSNNEITIVIISHKSKKKVINLISEISNNLKIVVVENSYDRTIENEIFDLKKNIKLIFSKNNGYGSAINLARKYVNTKYFFVLNPDIQKIDDKFTEVFYNSAKELNDNFGALGPRFLNVSDKSHKQSNINEKFGNIESIQGSCMFFCSEIFDKNQGFDENIFLYFDETDYCYRSNKNGFKIYQINSQKIYHNIGTSVEATNNEELYKLKKLYTWHFIWSKFYFLRKKYGKFIGFIICMPVLLRIIIRIYLSTISGNEKNKKKYKIRLDGLISSFKNNKSHKRIEDF